MGSDDRLRVITGRSTQKKTRDAVAEALAPLAAAKDGLGLVLVYGSVKHKHAQVVADIRRALGPVPLLGGTTTGEIHSAGISQDGLVLCGLASSLLEAGVGFGREVFRDPAAAAREAVAMARAELGKRGNPGRARRVCLLHTAGFTLDKPGVEEHVLAAVRAELGEGWEVLGGSASDGATFLGSAEYASDQALERSVVLALIETDLEVHHAMAHGFVPTEESFAVTEVAGPLVKRIEGKVALDFYAELLGVPPKELTKGLGLIRMTDKVPKFLTAVSQKMGLTPQTITEKIAFFKHSLEHPFGVRSGDAYVVKVPKVITPEGWLEFQTGMDGVERLQRMRLDPEATLTASARAVGAVTAAASAPPKLVLVYECLGRFLYLQKQLDPLFARIRAASDAELVGFFSAAEQGTMRGVACQTHNYTTSVLSLG